jgi:hypothetical protein
MFLQYDIKDLGRYDPGPAIYPALNKGGAELNETTGSSINIIKEKLNLSFSDVTFSNFNSVKVDLAQCSHLFEVGVA